MEGEIVINKGTPSKKKKQCLHGTIMGCRYSSESCLNFDLVKVSKLDHQLLLVRTLSDTDEAFDKSTTKNHLKSCSKGLVKKKVPKIKLCAAMQILEKDSENSFRTRLSLARCFASQFPEVIILHSVHEGKIGFKRSLIRQIGGSRLNSQPKYYPDEDFNSSRESDVPSSTETNSSVSEDISRRNEATLTVENGYEKKVTLKSISVIRRELPESSNLGWPLLRFRTTLGHAASRRSKARSMSLVEWVMSLPRRYSDTIMQNQIDSYSYENNISFNSKTEDSIRKESIVKESDDGSVNREDEEYGLIKEFSSGRVSDLTEESTQLTAGWPLLRIKTSASVYSAGEPESSNESVTTCVMRQPNQSLQDIPKPHFDLTFNKVENPAEKDFCYWEAPSDLKKKEKLLLSLKSSGCKQFSYEELKRATHNFSSENLIGEGGCSIVYKGSLRWGKLVAVKVLKQYEEAWNDFSLEVGIISSLKHKHITHLIGVCTEDSHLILIYDFLSKGSLEERLQGHNEKSTLSWKMRFKVAVAIAEAINYLHNGCSRPVIHRDVKSSNILLSDDFQPQLSDFGLATRGPQDSAYLITSDIVGTFGYIAPEYFTHGRVSDKSDIYSFGIVLLELLTGKKPISSESTKGQESLVKWAVPLLETGNLEELLDPTLGGEFDVPQIKRMVLAAGLCIKQSPRLRPKANQILELLRKEKGIKEWMNASVNDLQESTNEEVDDFNLEFDHNPPYFTSCLVLDGAAESLPSASTASLSNVQHKHRSILKDHLKQQQD